MQVSQWKKELQERLVGVSASGKAGRDEVRRAGRDRERLERKVGQLVIEKEFLEKKCGELGIDLNERP